MHVRVDGMDNLPNTALLTNPVSALALVQSKFGLMKLSGEIRIIELVDITKSQLAGETRGVNFYRKPDAELLIKRFLETLPIPSDTKKVIGDFWVNPNTFVYDAIAFSPLATPATTLNYWIGHTANPNAGDWSVIRDFLLHVICDGDKKVFLYLLCYLAHMLQKPEEKPGIMIVMLGAQGTGKGTFFFLMKRIWSKTALQVADVDQVIGRFNAALEQNYVILMDEALFAGDKKSTEKLKSLITEPSIGIEQKYQPSRTIDSYHRFFAASNNDHFAHIDRDDRRFLFLRVSSARQGDSAYFTTLFSAITDAAVINAMVHDLLQMDLSSFNVRQRPKTKEHLKQKIQSLSGFERYWYEVLVNRGIPGPHRYVEQWLRDAADRLDRYEQEISLLAECAALGKPLRSLDTDGDHAPWLKKMPKQIAYLMGYYVLPAIRKLNIDGVSSTVLRQQLPDFEKQIRGLLDQCEVSLRIMKQGIKYEYDRWKDGESALLPLIRDSQALVASAQSLLR